MGFWMRRALGWAIRRSREDEGQALVEYALLVSLISLASFAILEVLGLRLASLYTSIVNQIP